jgi:hypothetical protein
MGFEDFEEGGSMGRGGGVLLRPVERRSILGLFPILGRSFYDCQIHSFRQIAKVMSNRRKEVGTGKRGTGVLERIHDQDRYNTAFIGAAMNNTRVLAPKIP